VARDIVPITTASPQPVPATPAGPNYYVDPSGNDSNPGTLARPWLTLDGARSNLRISGLSDTATAPVTVNVGAGDYWLPSTLTFATADSGLSYPVIYKSSTPGAAKVYGGTRVTNWSLVSGSIYRAPVATRVTAVWENGIAARQARFPAYSADASYPRAQNTYLNCTGEASQTILKYGVGDLSPAAWDTNSTRIAVWSGGQVVVTGGSRAWFQDVIPIQSINTGARQLTLSAATIYNVFATVGGRYFAVGDLSFLVGPGQWYHDMTNGFLYYWARDGAIASQTIVIPAMDKTIAFAGTSAVAPVKNIAIDGLDVQYSESVYTYQVSDWSNRLKAAVYMENTQAIGVQRCNVHNTGVAGIYLHGANTKARIENSWVHDTGGYGVLMENFPGISPDAGDVSTGHLLSNTRVGNTGTFVGHGSAVYILNAGSILVTHCDLHDSPRCALEMASGAALLPAQNYLTGNVVQLTAARNAGQDSGDTGAFYVGQTVNKAQRWNQLTIDNSAATASMTDEDPHAFMCDDNSANQIISNVNATNTQGTVRHNHSGGSLVETNVSWNGGFDSSLMDPTIGLVSGNPYA